jgi:ATP-dependent Clp protease, protease subunit
MPTFLINRLLAQHSGQPLERLERDTDRNFWMSAAEAKAYGFIDEIARVMTP